MSRGASDLAAAVVSRMNRYQVSGQIRLPGIEADIVIVRDEKGMPYIHAQLCQSTSTVRIGVGNSRYRTFGCGWIR
jgi:hypothetical protein